MHRLIVQLFSSWCPSHNGDKRRGCRAMTSIKEVRRVSDTIWEIPTSYKEGMRVPARIFGTEKLIEQMDEAVYEQVTNVATLPGITQYALCMPDGHSGYGFPIGGVA